MAERLRALFCDHLSIMRGKYLPASKIGSGNSRFCQSLFGTHYDRDLLEAPGAKTYEGLPDMELRWTKADIRDGWEPNTKIVLGDLYDLDGSPLPLCPRGMLKRAISDWAEHGLAPKVGIELEAFAMVADEDGRLVPYDAPGGVVYGTGPFSDPLRFNDRIWDRAEALGFKLDMLTAEFDTPQFEYTLTFDDALKAVDDIVLFRQMAREIAFEFGVILTFMPKPIAQAGGSGMHINLSFNDKKGKNAVSGALEPMNDLTRGCVAGLVHHHKGMAALLAPTATSYQRLQPGSLSGYWQNWGGDHRNVTTRISNDTGTKARMEHRMADGTANPYVAVATVLQAARMGFENGYDLPHAETGDGFENNDAKTGVALNLKGAVADLDKDAMLQRAVGVDYCNNHLYMKAKEVLKTKDLEADDLRDFYVWFV